MHVRFLKDNNMLKMDTKTFYKVIEKIPITVNTTRSKEMLKFWKNNIKHTELVTQFHRIATDLDFLEVKNLEDIKVNDVRFTLGK